VAGASIKSPLSELRHDDCSDRPTSYTGTAAAAAAAAAAAVGAKRCGGRAATAPYTADKSVVVRPSFAWPSRAGRLASPHIARPPTNRFLF